jgi:hypothetical protein
VDVLGGAALKRIHWRKASDVAGAVLRFTEGHARALRDGRYSIRGAGHEIVVRVNHPLGTVLFLYFYRRSG